MSLIMEKSSWYHARLEASPFLTTLMLETTIHRTKGESDQHSYSARNSEMYNSFLTAMCTDIIVAQML